MKKYIVYQNGRIEHIASTKKDAEEYIATRLQLAARYLEDLKKKDFKIRHKKVWRKYMISQRFGFYGGRAINRATGKLTPMWYNETEPGAWVYYDKADAQDDINDLREELPVEMWSRIKLIKLPRRKWIEYKEVM